MFRSIVDNRNWSLITLLIRRELKVKYRGSILGYLWSMLNPLFFMLIISFVFSKLMRGIENYDMFVLSGILFWNMTQHAIMGGTSSFVGNSGLLLKVKTPIWIYAVVPLGSALTNFVLALVPYLLFLLIKGIPVPLAILFLPFLLVLYSLFLTGIALTLSTMNVFFRDVAHVMESVIQLLFYATLIIYDRRNPMIPENIKEILGLNPLTRFVEFFRDVLFKTTEFDFRILLILVFASLISLAVGAITYKKNRTKIAFKL